MKITSISKSNFVNLLKEFIEESDKGASILLAAELDELLLKILSKKLLPESSNKGPDLLSECGSLGNFASRIEISYRLGIIPKVTAHNLHMIRGIRNLFAHQPLGLNFDSQKIKDKIRNFKKLIFNKSNNKICFLEPDLADPRQAFVEEACFLIGYLESILREVKQVRENTIYKEKV